MMHLMLDKSTLQSLSWDESIRLGDHYYSVYAPTLFVEIMGDLKRAETEEDRLRHIVNTAKKVHGVDSCISANYRILLRAELSGHDVEMAGRPIVLDGQRIPNPDGNGFGIFRDEEAEHGILRRWLACQWSEAELAAADIYRKSTKSIDLTWLIRIWRDIPKFKTLDEIDQFSRFASVDLAKQGEYLRVLLLESDFTGDEIAAIMRRWIASGRPNLAVYAPYTFFCIRVFLFFYAGVGCGLLSSRATNRVDLEYLLYLPFTLLFTSSDRFLRDMAKYFLSPRQEFLWGLDFKEAMQSYVAHYNSLGRDGVQQWKEEFGFSPLPPSGHLTTRLRGKYLGPPRPIPPEQRQTPEQKAAEFAKVKALVEHMKRHIRPKRDLGPE